MAEIKDPSSPAAGASIEIVEGGPTGRNALVEIPPGDAPARVPGVAPTPKPADASRSSGVLEHDYTEPGSVFVRTCSECSTLHQTFDGSGKTPCRVCTSMTKPAPTPKPETKPETLPAPAIITGHDVERREMDAHTETDDEIPPALSSTPSVR